jgi:hypothetical protein
MPLNIITHGTKTRKVSNEEMAERLAQTNREAMIREKHEYNHRSRQIRKNAENFNFGKGIKGKAVIDAKTYFRHEQENPGCWADKSFTKSMLRDNPEMRLD